jgi:hypothetical protein
MVNPMYPHWGDALIEISLYEQMCKYWMESYDNAPKEVRDRIKERGS